MSTTISTSTGAPPILAANPMEPKVLSSAPRCQVKARSGLSCRSPAMKGKRVCRVYGGHGSGAPTGEANRS